MTQPSGRSVGDRLIEELASGRWDRFECAAAFAKLSGVRYIDGSLRSFEGGGGEAIVGVGVDSEGTSFEAVNHLASAVSQNGRLVVSKHLGGRGTTSFHPKAYLFSNSQSPRALAIIGSNNLTEGGLFTNHEMSVAVSLDSSERKDKRLVDQLRRQLEIWHDPKSGLAVTVDARTMRELKDAGWLPLEVEIKAALRRARATTGRRKQVRKPRGFGKQPAAPGPAHSQDLGDPLVLLPQRRRRKPPRTPKRIDAARHDVLCIDITVGDKTEIFLSKNAVRDDPAFFGHPFKGSNRPKKPGKNPPQPELSPRPNVDLRLLGGRDQELMVEPDHRLRVWEYVEGRANGDVRLTIPQRMRRKLPKKGCILEMRRRPVRRGVTYELNFLTPGSPKWTAARAIATNHLPNSSRRYGWA